MSWGLTCAGARLCQTLGWHRGIIGDEADSRSLGIKEGLFWTLYFTDKCLSLRLGISATFQDHDLALGLPLTTSKNVAPELREWGRFLDITIELSALHGLVYEKLYSPGSAASTIEDRMITVHELGQRVQKAISDNDEVGCPLVTLMAILIRRQADHEKPRLPEAVFVYAGSVQRSDFQLLTHPRLS